MHSPTRVYFPCTGLGRQQRGFETFTRECAAALSGDPRLDITVFGGGGPHALASERAVFNFPRDGIVAGALGAVTRRGPYFVEQASFFAGFLPALARGKPDVVYFADLNLGNACWHWRRLTGQKFKLLFYNGGATTRPFTRCDMVQEVSPAHRDDAIARGESAERLVLLPHAVPAEKIFRPPSAEERARTRAALGVPPGRNVVLSVGMLDAHVKRMDYVVREIAALGPERPFLVLAGAPSNETPAIVSLARELLGDDGFVARAFPSGQMSELYRAADAFVLASFREGFGLVILEALREGLGCIAHDTPTTAFVGGPHTRRADLSVRGALGPLVTAAIAARDDTAAMALRHEWVLKNFSWDALRERHIELLGSCAKGERPAWAAT